MSDPLEAAEVRILRLQPGDEIVLIVKDDRPFWREVAADLQAKAEERWPGHRVTVLGNIEMEVVRR